MTLLTFPVQHHANAHTPHRRPAPRYRGGRATAVEAHRRPQELLPSTDPALAANKKLVFDFWRVVLQAHHVDRAPEFLAEGYVQHNPNVATGRAAFMEFFGQFPPEPVKEQIDDLVSIVAERDLVVLAFRRELPDLAREGQTYTTTSFDMSSGRRQDRRALGLRHERIALSAKPAESTRMRRTTAYSAAQTPRCPVGCGHPPSELCAPRIARFVENE